MGNILVDLYEEWIEDDLKEIKAINSENKLFQEIREKHQGDWEVVEACREILFLNAKQIRSLMERIEDAKSTIKEFLKQTRAAVEEEPG